MSKPKAIPPVSDTSAQDGSSTKANTLGMQPMQERAYQKCDSRSGESQIC